MNAVLIHAASGTLALATIIGFFGATVISEAFGTFAHITAVKTAILYLIPLLVVFMATAGALGNRAATGWSDAVVTVKRRRMAAIAANGILVLIPCAYFLYRWAQADDFGPAFVALQALELVAGAGNISLLALNLRDGRRLHRLTHGG